MRHQDIYKKINARKGQIAVLIDPEKCTDQDRLKDLLKKSAFANIDYFFVGGSTVTRKEFTETVEFLKQNTEIPIVIFPGASHQVSGHADGLLYLSLISGRNPDYLIGHHVQSAPEVYNMEIEVIPTGYILVDGGRQSSVAYVSQTTPIPSDKSSIIINTAKAGILQGKKMIYLDSGSGALEHVPSQVIKETAALNVPVIVGGGIRSKETINELNQAGANVIVIGNKIEEDVDFLLDISTYIKENHQ